MRLKRLAVAVASAVMLSGLAVPPAHATAGDFNPPQVTIKQGVKWERGATLSDNGRTPNVNGTISWTAYDPDGICSQTIYYYNYTTGAEQSVALSTTAKSYTLPVSIGSSFWVEVDATDCSGNNNGVGYDSNYIYPTMAQETAATYTAGWQTASCTCYSLGAVLKAKKAGSSATYRFTGSSIALIMPKASNRGSVNIFVNGVKKATINLAGATSNRNVVWESSWTSSAARTIQVTSVSAAQVDVDAFISAY